MEDVLETRPQDKGANTFSHILDTAEKIEIPNLERLGINKILNHKRLKDIDNEASYGKLNLKHYGADSYAGHQEIMGSDPIKPLMVPFATYSEEVKNFLRDEGFEVEIPDEKNPYLLVNNLVIVADNIETDYGQIYNVSAPLDHISFKKVQEIARLVRKVVKVNRVIALGGHEVSPEHLKSCIERRSDGLIGVNSPKSGVYNKGYQARHMGYGIDSNKQISNILIRNNIDVTLIGKMQDVIECESATKIPAVKTELVMEEIIQSMDKMDKGLISATVQETDLCGHSEDVQGYSDKIMIADKYLGVILDKMTNQDILFISADHGNDPTIGHSQHTREKTFLLVYGKGLNKINLSERESLSDIAATIAEYFDVNCCENGESFYKLLKKNK